MLYYKNYNNNHYYDCYYSFHNITSYTTFHVDCRNKCYIFDTLIVSSIMMRTYDNGLTFNVGMQWGAENITDCAFKERYKNETCLKFKYILKTGTALGTCRVFSYRMGLGLGVVCIYSVLHLTIWHIHNKMLSKFIL